MQYVAIVTLLILVQYIVYMMLVGAARGKDNVQAPATVGGENFERAFRVQMNTLEQMAVALPAMWICASFYSPLLATAGGVVFMLGRLLYRFAYVKDPASRGPGMMIGFLAIVVMIVMGMWGAIGQITL